VTTTLPVVAPLGTVALMRLALQLVVAAATPLNATVLLPWVLPKFVPVIVTGVPTGPAFGFTLVMLGVVGFTVKLTELLTFPLTITVTGPVVAPVGTVVLMLAVLQLLTVATVLLNVRVLVPCKPPKFDPVIVIGVPTTPDAGLTLAMLGGLEVAVLAEEHPCSSTETNTSKAVLKQASTQLAALT
jgi:hypothetical protein